MPRCVTDRMNETPAASMTWAEDRRGQPGQVSWHRAEGRDLAARPKRRADT